MQRVDAAAVGHAVLAVGREDEVLRTQRAAGADLGGLLAEQLGPDAELAVAMIRQIIEITPAKPANRVGWTRACTATPPAS
ncbi:hypothetical protein, partial [Nocardia salmonicida]|uniref:hypothetical protein n=1 Tax=Nocardia salmonicida TaxID=53431 RepID=UPI0033E65894